MFFRWKNIIHRGQKSTIFLLIFPRLSLRNLCQGQEVNGACSNSFKSGDWGAWVFTKRAPLVTCCRHHGEACLEAMGNGPRRDMPDPEPNNRGLCGESGTSRGRGRSGEEGWGRCPPCFACWVLSRFIESPASFPHQRAHHLLVALHLSPKGLSWLLHSPPREQLSSLAALLDTCYCVEKGC